MASLRIKLVASQPRRRVPVVSFLIADRSCCRWTRHLRISHPPTTRPEIGRIWNSGIVTIVVHVVSYLVDPARQIVTAASFHRQSSGVQVVLDGFVWLTKQPDRAPPSPTLPHSVFSARPLSLIAAAWLVLQRGSTVTAPRGCTCINNGMRDALHSDKTHHVTIHISHLAFTMSR